MEIHIIARRWSGEKCPAKSLYIVAHRNAKRFAFLAPEFVFDTRDVWLLTRKGREHEEPVHELEKRDLNVMPHPREEKNLSYITI
jgi:hypothetical protein